MRVALYRYATAGKVTPDPMVVAYQHADSDLSPSLLSTPLG